MLRDEYVERLVNGAHVQLYLSANDGARLWWPWRMQPPKESSQRYRDACDRYIIDSDPLDDSVSATDVLDCAVGLNADVASLQDVYLDKDETVDSLMDGLAVADDHVFDGGLLLPLQEPWVECWQELGEPTEYLLGVGGLKDSTPARRLDATRSLRAVAGDDVWIHGFGWGVAGLAEPIRQEPHLLDSLDYSTPIQNAAINDSSPGKERMSVAAMDAAQQLVRDLREVSEWPDETTPEGLRAEGQSGLESHL